MSASDLFHTTCRDDTLILHLHDSTASQWLESFRELAPILDRSEFADARYIVADCTNLSFAGSMLLEALVRLGQRAREGGGKLVLCGLNDDVREVVHTARFDQLWDAYACVEEALRALKATRP